MVSGGNKNPFFHIPDTSTSHIDIDTFFHHKGIPHPYSLAPLLRGFLLVERQKKRPLVAGGPESFALESALGVLAGEVEAEGGQSHANHKEQEPSGSHINPPW